MPNMISLRTFRMASLSGHVVQFESNVPKFVHDDAVSEAMAQGCVPADSADAPFIEDTLRAKVEFQGDIRKAMIHIAIDLLVKKNDAKDFDGGAVPKVASVAARLGYEVSRQEVIDIYQQYMQGKSEGREVVLDAKAKNAMRVIEAEDKAELLELAEEFGVAKAKAKGLQIRDLRKLLLVKLTGVAAA